MARPKARIRKALSDAHLKGIGLVAATWADLEFMLMYLIAQESGTTSEKTFAMIAGSGMQSWLDVLKRLLVDGGKPWLWEAFVKTKMQARLEVLHGHRNNIVHASWNVPSRENRLLDLLIPITKPPEKASGIGFKKKGKDLVVFYSYTAAEMRQVAKDIEVMRKELLAWSASISPERRRQLLAQALMAPPRKRRNPSGPKTPTK